MSSAQVVRKPLRVRERSSRTIDQRLALRFPALAVGFARLFARLPSSSRLRQAILWRGVRLSAEAFNRRDLDVLLVRCHPEYELYPAHEFVAAGFMPPCYRGAEGWRAHVSDWSDVWGPDIRLEPLRVIDLGTRVVVLYDVPVRAQASGIPLTEKWATVGTLKQGRLIRDQVFLDHAEALEAVGLSE